MTMIDAGKTGLERVVERAPDNRYGQTRFSPSWSKVDNIRTEEVSIISRSSQICFLGNATHLEFGMETVSRKLELTSARGHPHQTSSCDSGCGIFTHSSPDSSALVRKRQMHCKERKKALENMGSELQIPWSCLSIVCRVLLVQLLYICIRKKCSERFHLLWALF